MGLIQHPVDTIRARSTELENHLIDELRGQKTFNPPAAGHPTGDGH